MSEFQTITLGGGCFWCLEAIFSRIEGTIAISPGYSAGHKIDPSYKEVCSGDTGHAEVIEIQYDSTKVTLETLVQFFFATHDATTLNRQGNDIGTQYRSIICYANEREKKIAQKIMAAEQEKLDNKIVTEIVPLKTFYPAEIEHFDYYEQNSTQPYCQMVIRPKLDKLVKWKSEQQ